VCVDVFEYEETTDSFIVKQRGGSEDFPDILNVLYFRGHFCFIKDIDRVSQTFVCSRCEKIWKTNKHLQRHLQTCTGNPAKFHYPGGVYQVQPSIFDLLKMNGFDVSSAPFTIFPYRATWDMEVYFDQSDLPQTSTTTTQYTARHVPMSASVCSNVPGYTKPICFISDGNPQVLIDRMIDYLERISDTTFQLLYPQFREIYKQLEARESREKEES
ncbi:hypothetical protein BaRGS_00029359, partial [Batillaria attramentaria]